MVAKQLTVLLASKSAGARATDPTSISKKIGNAYSNAQAAAIFPSSSTSSSSSSTPSKFL